MPIRLRRTLSALVLLLTAACGGDSSGPSVQLSISGYSAALGFIGASVRLSATATSGQLPSIDWSSANPAVASVDPSGLVTAIAPGTTAVTAKGGGATASVSVVVDPVPASLVVRGGDAQQAVVGSALPAELIVEVLDAGGSAVPGETVAFEVAGDGAVSPASATTDADGQARASWTLGTAAGMQTVTARSGAASVDASAQASPDAPSEVLAEGGNGQVGLAGAPLPNPLEVRVTDRYGNGVPQVSVGFQSATGSGSSSSDLVMTDAEGVASVEWTLGRYAGEQSLSAEAQGVSGVTFMANALPNGVIQGTATLVSAWFSAPATAARQVHASPKAVRDELRQRRTAERTTVAPDFALPGPELLVRLHTSDQPVFRQSAAERGAATAQAAALREMAGSLRSADDFRILGVSPAIQTLRVTPAAGVDRDELIRALRSDPAVETVERNGVATIHRSLDGHRSSSARGPVPSPDAPSPEPLYVFQAWHYEAIGLDDAWKLTRGVPGVVVAVIDDGVRFDHHEIGGALLDDGFDFVEDGDLPRCFGGTISNSGDGDGPDPDPTIPALYHLDDTRTCIESVGGRGGHGTHVAGTIGARDGNGGGLGVAPETSILPIRVMGPHGSGSLYSIAQGVLYAAGLPADGGSFGIVQLPYRSHVINLSLGGPNDNATLRAAIEAAWAAGSLIVGSAGNAGNADPNFPASYPEVMSVSALGPSWTRPGYSSFGPNVEISAPGGGLGDAGDSSFGVWSAIWDFDTGEPFLSGWDGTSMAAPHVAGVAALLFAQDPGRTAAEVRALLVGHARDLGPAGPDDLYGYGMLDALGSLTNGAGLPGDRWAGLFDAATGAMVDATPIGTDGAYAFGGLEDGNYYVYAGADEFGDGGFGLPSRPFSAFGGGSHPTPIVVDGAGELSRSFSFGNPLESEPNGTVQEADRLIAGGYIEATLDGGSDMDVFRVEVPEAGRYRFESYGVWGACGFALVPDTVLDLLDANGQLMDTADDIDTGARLYCSALEVDLEPGTYHLRVRAFSTSSLGGTYGLWSGRQP